MSNLFLSPQSRIFRQNPMGLARDLFDWDPWLAARTAKAAPEGVAFVPQFEVRESETAFLFLADLPGVAEADVEITIEENRLTIGGKREAEEKREGDNYHLYERTFGSFSRTFVLPEGADSEAIEAKLDNGVLTVEVAKRDKIKPRKISIGQRIKAKLDNK